MRGAKLLNVRQIYSELGVSGRRAERVLTITLNNPDADFDAPESNLPSNDHTPRKAASSSALEHVWLLDLLHDLRKYAHLNKIERFEMHLEFVGERLIEELRDYHSNVS